MSDEDDFPDDWGTGEQEGEEVEEAEEVAEVYEEVAVDVGEAAKGDGEEEDLAGLMAAAEAALELEDDDEVEEVAAPVVGKPAKSTPKVASVDDIDMDALMAAAEAAGACDEANAVVAGALPPSKKHWVPKDLDEVEDTTESVDAERKRCRPPGLMTSAAALQMTVAAKKAKKAGKHIN